jgi:hypothetical protein
MCPCAANSGAGSRCWKLRGSDHDKAVREFRIADAGTHIGDPFPDIAGLV